MTVQIPPQDKTAERSLSFLQTLLRDVHPRDFEIRLWDGSIWPSETGEPRFRLVLKHAGALRRMFQAMDTDLHLGEAYIYDDFDIEGDIEAAFSLADYLMGLDWSAAARLRLGWDLLHLPRERSPRAGRRPAVALEGDIHSLERDRHAVTYHYDVSNDFFALFLDRRMVYSCAYFSHEDEDLDVAQERKLDYVCRKLRLHPGQRLLDIGCGWGSLVQYAARHYGVEAIGITLSRPQAEYAAEKTKQEGLADRCRVEVLDYREAGELGAFDALVSIGMFEHVGEALLPEYFRIAWELLRPAGVFLNHGIACRAMDPRPSKPTFSDRYVFPDGELVPISTSLRVAEEMGFEVRDVESLREHYALTLRHWVRRLEANDRQALEVVDELTYRVWRLFMSGSAHGFTTGRLNIYQALLVKPDGGRSGLPLTRADWYVG